MRPSESVWMKLGPWRYFTFSLAVVYLVVVVVLPTLALIVAGFRKFLFIRDVNALFDLNAYSLIHFERLFDNPLAMRFPTAGPRKRNWRPSGGAIPPPPRR